MDFRLTYEGPLGASQRDSDKQQQKRHIRGAIHPQLKTLWEITPFLRSGERSGPSAFLLEGPELLAHDIASLAARYKRDGWSYVPLVTEDLDLICGLEILFLRRGKPGQLIWAGDIDNRIKTLLDALKIPESNESYGASNPPTSDEDPLFCLLEDDKLITRLSVETDQLLDPMPSGTKADHVKLVITVRLRPFELHLGNMQFG